MCGPNYVGKPGKPGWDGSDDPNDVPPHVREARFDRKKREKVINKYYADVAQ